MTPRRVSVAAATPLPSSSAVAEPLLTIPDVAALLLVSERTVHRLVAKGTLRRHRVGRLVRISRADLQAYLTRQRLA
ncbi:helix-turn-helix domain-containing protein [Sabulicella glaciei]|uniref:Helix-turn-helix domain-containing protein n=1 Tax=Sabulicella glaciei TaxID=2984948 RepID=A0ABT3NZU1_9PROT|nr:helix-turn-helix domain-containing protein [Roseococcus sp. MDT2-1-1]MCW8087674.1 helix-turn-helix domain-containing protein [Roseococcus sp. MDT2-1-1]